MLRDFLIEYKDGFFDSIQGFLILRKLDNPPKNVVASAQPRASSVEPHSKPTVLEKRRMQQKKDGKKTNPSSVPIQIKVPAVKRVMEIVALNIFIIGMLQVLCWITEWIVSNKDSNLYTFCSYFRIMLILPIFIVIRIFSTLWFADVANAAFRYRGSSLRSSTSIDFSRAASDFINSIIAEFIFLLQALVLALIPVPVFGKFLSLIYMSLLHSLYSFEYMWMSRNVSMNSRLSHIERHWPYHLGFGTILTVLTSLSESFVINSCVFGALFPFFIVSSFLADIPEYHDSKVGQICFFHYAQLITNRLSLTFYRFISPEIKTR